MNDDEYEQRRRALEDMYQADLLMVRAAHETRLRCLEALRLTPAPPADSAAGPPPPTPPAPAPAPPPARNQNPYLLEAILEALPDLPELFTKEDVVRAIGFTPSRSSLQRVLSSLVFKKIVRFESLSQGRHTTTYRKVEAPSPA